ncbi:transcription-repair coupling factor (Superfamily II helicase)-like protein, partial [Escherichia coli EC1865]
RLMLSPPPGGDSGRP